MQWMRRHPVYASWIAFLLMTVVIAAFTPAGNLVIPFVLGLAAVAIAVGLYRVLTRRP